MSLPARGALAEAREREDRVRDLAQIVADDERAAERELAEARVDAEQLRLFDRWSMERELRRALKESAVDAIFPPVAALMEVQK